MFSSLQVDRCFQQIDEIFIRSLQSVQRIIIQDKHCFELYGYDILLDVQLRPWLIEVNASPSLTASSKEDYDLKSGLLEDTLNVIDLEQRWEGGEGGGEEDGGGRGVDGEGGDGLGLLGDESWAEVRRKGIGEDYDLTSRLLENTLNVIDLEGNVDRGGEQGAEGEGECKGAVTLGLISWFL